MAAMISYRDFAPISAGFCIGTWIRPSAPEQDLDRFHLVQDVVDRLPRLGAQGAYLKQRMQDKLIEHQRYVINSGRAAKAIPRAH